MGVKGKEGNGTSPPLPSTKAIISPSVNNFFSLSVHGSQVGALHLGFACNGGLSVLIFFFLAGLISYG